MTKYVETTTSADTAAWMGRALAAEKQLAAAVARAEAAEGDAAYWQSVHADNEAYALAKFREYKLELARLRARLAAREWRPFVDEPNHPGRPENDQDCQVLVEASYIRSHYHGDDNKPGTWLAADYKVLDGLVLAWRPAPPGGDEDEE